MREDRYTEVYQAVDGWRWHTRSAGNHEVLFDSSEAFTRHAYALEHAVENNPDTPIVDVDG